MAVNSTRFRAATVAAVFLLLAQYVLGMAINLFVTIPRSHPGAKPAEYFSGSAQSVAWAVLHGNAIWLQIHAVLGLLLVVLAAVLLIAAIATRRPDRIAWTAVGLFAVLGAAFNGASFLDFNENFSSMLMASGFAVAVAAYVLALRSG